ncbi:DUF4272 domain-containing protein [Parendozoicomonas haliclonae]|uniref:DUF4272 domain-containing protein n=1 Tax=Parendozoicomonas haliclonae TaxID=1960125 RepID=A0A1X7AU67_9GAMM|nr:DUF4272 domain-containing protein [Parendozoicomonas haliclonae]SMA50967.1 hypothetical protein EHSB41UT_04788 [Parendozoicomonas haliclonae]
MSPEERKKQTERFLSERNIPFIDWLPPTEDESEVTPRTIKEIGERILCLFCLSGTAFNEGDTEFVEYLKNFNLWDSLTKEEKHYLSNPTYGTQTQINATWRLEALYVLVWAVKLVPDLPYPSEEASVTDFIDRIPTSSEDPISFINSLELRPISEIMDASDIIYRMHWAVRNYESSIDIDGGVIRERHHAINWLTNYDGESWDWVATDT